MKIVYIAHPVGDNVEENLQKVVEIGRQINLNEPGVVPFAPYFFDCHCLDDNEPKERQRGMKNGEHFFLKGVIDEVRLYGEWISQGMGAEIQLAHELGIPVVPMNHRVAFAYSQMWNAPRCHTINRQNQKAMRHNPRPKYKKGYTFRRPNGNIYRVDRSYICNHGFPMYHVDMFGGPDPVLKGPLWKAMKNAFFENMLDASTQVLPREIKRMCAHV